MTLLGSLIFPTIKAYLDLHLDFLLKLKMSPRYVLGGFSFRNGQKPCVFLNVNLNAHLVQNRNFKLGTPIR